MNVFQKKLGYDEEQHTFFHIILDGSIIFLQ